MTDLNLFSVDLNDGWGIVTSPTTDDKQNMTEWMLIKTPGLHLLLNDYNTNKKQKYGRGNETCHCQNVFKL